MGNTSAVVFEKIDFDKCVVCVCVFLQSLGAIVCIAFVGYSRVRDGDGVKMFQVLNLLLTRNLNLVRQRSAILSKPAARATTAPVQSVFLSSPTPSRNCRLLLARNVGTINIREDSSFGSYLSTEWKTVLKHHHPDISIFYINRDV